MSAIGEAVLCELVAKVIWKSVCIARHIVSNSRNFINDRDDFRLRLNVQIAQLDEVERFDDRRACCDRFGVGDRSQIEFRPRFIEACAQLRHMESADCRIVCERKCAETGKHSDGVDRSTQLRHVFGLHNCCARRDRIIREYDRRRNIGSAVRSESDSFVRADLVEKRGVRSDGRNDHVSSSRDLSAPAGK